MHVHDNALKFNDDLIIIQLYRAFTVHAVSWRLQPNSSCNIVSMRVVNQLTWPGQVRDAG